MPLVAPVNLEPLLKVNQSHLAHLDQLVMLDHPAHLDPLDHLETMEHQDNLDLKDHPAPLETPDPMDNPDLLDKQDLPVVLEKRVSAPNIAPSTVVSSSKMEPDDDKHLRQHHFGTAKYFTAIYCNCFFVVLFMSHAQSQTP